MRSVRSFAPLAAGALLASGLAAIAVVMTVQVGATAQRLQLANAARLTTTMSDYLGGVLAANKVFLTQLEGSTPIWSLRPGSQADRSRLDAMARSIGPKNGIALLDATTGRRLLAAGPAAAFPVGARMDAGFVATARSGELAMSSVLPGVSGHRILSLAVRSRGNQQALLAVYEDFSEAGLDLYLQQFGRGVGATFFLVDQHGTVGWSTRPDLLGRPVPGLAATGGPATGWTRGTHRATLGGQDTVVIARAFGNYPWTMVFETPAAALLGGLETETRVVILAVVGGLALAVIALGVAAQRRQRSLASGAQRLRELVANVNDAVFVLDGEKVTYASPGVRQLLDIDESAAVGAGVADLIGLAGADALRLLVAAGSGTDRPLTAGEVPCRTVTGRLVWAEVTVADRSREVSVGGTVVSLHDVTERRETAERLVYQATHDRLTGLANRAKFGEEVERTLHRVRRGDELFAVLYLDLDGFKAVNDSHGHPVGDVVLQQVAGRISGCLRTGDLAARVGGDEFAILLESVPDGREAEDIARRVIAAVNKPLDGFPEAPPLGVSVGIVMGGRHTDSYSAVIRDADFAMYAAKESGRNCYQFFDAAVVPTAVPDQRHPVPEQLTEA